MALNMNVRPPELTSGSNPVSALFLLVTTCGLGIMIAFFSGGIALLVPVMAGVLTMTALARALIDSEDPMAQTRVLKWTIFSLVAHLLFGLVLLHAGGIVSQYLTAPDVNTYHVNAIQLLRHWTDGFPAPDLPGGKEGFYYLLAGLYWLFGAQTVAGVAFNATLAAALVPLVTDTTRRLFGSEAAFYVAPLVVLVPGLFLWTSQLLKEAAIVFLVAAAANFATRVVHRISLASLAGMAATLALLFTFRSWVALVMAAGFIAGIALGRRELLSGVATALTAASLVAVVLALGLGSSGYQAAVDSDLDQAQVVRQDLARSGASGFDSNVDISTAPGAISYLPRGMASFVLGPFPWQIQGARQLAVIPDVVVWWSLLPSLWRGQRSARQLSGRRFLVLVLPAAAAIVLLSLAVGNYGTVVRERMQILVLLVPLMGLGLSKRIALRPSSSENSHQFT